MQSKSSGSVGQYSLNYASEFLSLEVGVSIMPSKLWELSLIKSKICLRVSAVSCRSQRNALLGPGSVGRCSRPQDWVLVRAANC